MTLSQWFRDYLFFPLGGPYKGKIRTYMNLWIVFLLTGIWHGANWTFLIWGVYHGGMIFIERIIGIGKRKKHIYFWRIITVFLIYLGWIVFRSNSIEQAFVFYSNIFYPDNWDITLPLLSTLTHKNIIMITIGFLSLFFRRNWLLGDIWRMRITKQLYFPELLL